MPLSLHTCGSGRSFRPTCTPASDVYFVDVSSQSLFNPAWHPLRMIKITVFTGEDCIFFSKFHFFHILIVFMEMSPWFLELASSSLTKSGTVWSCKSAGTFEAHLPLQPPIAFEESFEGIYKTHSLSIAIGYGGDLNPISSR